LSVQAPIDTSYDRLIGTRCPKCGGKLYKEGEYMVREKMGGKRRGEVKVYSCPKCGFRRHRTVRVP